MREAAIIKQAKITLLIVLIILASVLLITGCTEQKTGKTRGGAKGKTGPQGQGQIWPHRPDGP